MDGFLLWLSIFYRLITKACSWWNHNHLRSQGSAPILKSIQHYSKASWNSRMKEVEEELTLPTSYVVACELI